MFFVRLCSMRPCEHDLSETAWGNFAKFMPLMHLGTLINLFDYEARGSKVKGQGHSRPNQIRSKGGRMNIQASYRVLPSSVTT